MNNTCALDGISSPDNVAYFADLDVLFIAEDTDYHQNEVAWAYDFKTGSLTRILSMPYGAEVRSRHQLQQGLALR